MDSERNQALREAIESFYFAYRAFTESPDRMLAEHGLGRVHHRILYFVGRNPGLTVNALLDVLKVTKQALNAPLRQLLELELIAVNTAEEDRRFKELKLTPAGKKLEARLSSTQLDHLAAAFAAAGPEAEAGWRAVMQQVWNR